ncbi:MAG: hypothetical protein WCJ29_04870 [bacterium]
MEGRDTIPAEQSALREKEKHRMLLIRVFAVCSIVAVSLLGVQIYFNVFKLPELQLAKATPDDDPNAILKAKDTDFDGISDYDEINFYSTSPYLADSDSDGIDDKTELVRGTDPNCPQGKQCSMVTELRAELKPSDLFVKVPEPVAPVASLDALASLKNMSPTEIRALMKKNGMTDDVLSKLSDEDLVKAYQDALAKTGVDQAEKAAVKADPTPEEIRKILVDNGMAQEDAAKISDEDLKTLYQDTLKKVAPPIQPKK